MSEHDLFGAISMGYLLIESERMEDWKRFLHKGIGLHLESEGDNLLTFRMDAHRSRIIVRRGTAEDVAAVGWQVEDPAKRQILLQRLGAYGIQFKQGGDGEAAMRGVKAFWSFKGPKELTHEIFSEALNSETSLDMLCSGFLTAEHGMGHVAITSRRPEKMLRFWTELFNARISDRITENIAGNTLDIAFLRLNPRHHSVAIAALRGLPLDPIRTQIQHFNMLVNSMDDVSNAYQRLRNLGFEMAHEIGQHPNDKEVSFYVLSPSGFEVEVGWNALAVDEDTWQQTHYHGISLWGHKPPKPGLANALSTNGANAVQGLRSLLKPEYSPI